MTAEADALARQLANDIGYTLMTVLRVDGDSLCRAYSSDPVAYPVSGRKKMRATPWGDHVLVQAKPWLGRNSADIAWAFPDHELISALGCGACINVPVTDSAGAVMGTLNLLDAAGRYDERHLERAKTYRGKVRAILPGLPLS